MVVVGVVAFLVRKNDVPPIGNSVPRDAGKGGVSEPASKTFASTETSPGTVFRDRLKDGSQGPAMVVVPAGTFRMGDGERIEQPIHRVALKAPFALGQFEVTVGEFRCARGLVRGQSFQDMGYRGQCLGVGGRLLERTLAEARRPPRPSPVRNAERGREKRESPLPRSGGGPDASDHTHRAVLTSLSIRGAGRMVAAHRCPRLAAAV